MVERIAPEVVKTLVRNHDQFLGFLQARLRSREAAEDVLQAALARGLEKGSEIRDNESATAWFYRVLRNALADHYRRNEVEGRALRNAAAGREAAADDPELEKAVCRCMKELMTTLKDEYSEILQRVELEGERIEDVARSEKITPNNAMVRLHRARKALHGRLVQTCGACTEHGCLECHCKD